LTPLLVAIVLETTSLPITEKTEFAGTTTATSRVGFTISRLIRLVKRHENILVEKLSVLCVLDFVNVCASLLVAGAAVKAELLSSSVRHSVWM
jgi:hypothetical protein